MIFLVAAALIGSALTVVFMAQSGILIALLSMPLGGSLSVLVAGLCLLVRRGLNPSERLESHRPNVKKAA
ncbi:hypothetical protein [Microvirga massiliensis]|uniref:hypothetical protein n=1 Tax=Microvirga massiliensis TaxID=1033741 RepID=UPI00062B834B|nr:hypothetical protein [Microvirga massiliensis]